MPGGPALGGQPIGFQTWKPNSHHLATWQEIANAARGAGFRDDRPSNDPGTKVSELQLAVAIAGAESGRDVTAVGGPLADGTFVNGLWQIKRPQVTPALFSAAANAGAAWSLYQANPKGERRFSGRWTTYDRKSYIPYLPAAALAVKQTHRDRPFVTRPGAVAGALTGWVGDLIGGLAPYLKIAAGGTLFLFFAAALVGVSLIRSEPGKAIAGAAGAVGGVGSKAVRVVSRGGPKRAPSASRTAAEPRVRVSSPPRAPARPDVAREREEARTLKLRQQRARTREAESEAYVARVYAREAAAARRTKVIDRPAGVANRTPRRTRRTNA